MSLDALNRRLFLRLAFGAGLALLVPCDVLAATSVTAKKSSHAKPVPRQRILTIDAGHGGHDPGAIGKSGTQEKDITLDIARRMASALSGERRVTAKLTRDDDIFLPLEERVRFGREAGADMMISVHADSAPNASARGLSVYTLSEHGSDEFSRALAKTENRADLVGGLNLPKNDREVSAILYDLVSRQTHNTALHARANFVRSIGRTWPLLERPMRAANFVVLRAPDMPSMLIETGFLSNAQDEQILRQPKQREKIARLMAKSLTEILNSALFV